MAYDGKAALRTGEKRPVYGQMNAGWGNTATIQAGGTFTLLDSAGAIVAGFNAVAVTGADPILQKPRVWYNLDSAALSADSWYTGRFTLSVLGSDGITRTLEPEVEIFIASKSEATYAAGTPLGRVRFYCADTQVDDAIFSDTELNACLNDAGGNVFLAVSLALEAMAVDKAKIAISLRLSTFGTDESGVYKAIVERAARYRKMVVFAPVVSSPDAVFSTTRDGGLTAGTMDGW